MSTPIRVSNNPIGELNRFTLADRRAMPVNTMLKDLLRSKGFGDDQIAAFANSGEAMDALNAVEKAGGVANVPVRYGTGGRA